MVKVSALPEFKWRQGSIESSSPFLSIIIIITFLKSHGQYTQLSSVLCIKSIRLHWVFTVGYPQNICNLAEFFFWRLFFTSCRENRKWEWVSWALVEPLIWEVRAWLFKTGWYKTRSSDHDTWIMTAFMSFNTIICLASKVTPFFKKQRCIHIF